MKNKKGFTLTEILVVIALLGVMTGSAVIGIDKINEKTKERRLNEIIKEIELAADVYINKNQVYREDILNANITEKCTRVYTLQNEDLLDFDLKNPVTNEYIPANLCVISKLDEEGIIVHLFEIE